MESLDLDRPHVCFVLMPGCGVGEMNPQQWQCKKALEKLEARYKNKNWLYNWWYEIKGRMPPNIEVVNGERGLVSRVRQEYAPMHPEARVKIDYLPRKYKVFLVAGQGYCLHLLRRRPDMFDRLQELKHKTETVHELVIALPKDGLEEGFGGHAQRILATIVLRHSTSRCCMIWTFRRLHSAMWFFQTRQDARRIVQLVVFKIYGQFEAG